MKRGPKLQKFFLFFLLMFLSMYLKPTINSQYRVPKVDNKIVSDGKLDEDIWKQALVMELRYEVRPGENVPPPVKTEVLLAFNKTHLFVGFRAYDMDPSKIEARICDRDKIRDQDWVAVVLDTFNDQRRSFVFSCNPFGVQGDIIEINGEQTEEWDAIWDSGGEITDFGYTVEMFIPFSSLRFQRKDGDQIWGFDAVRNYPRVNRHGIGLFPRDRNNNCYLCQSIKLVGFEGTKPGKNLEFDPTFSAHYDSQASEDDSGVFENSRKADPGITAHWGFTPNLTLSGTVNPDFSQVEADAPQMDINEPFALYFQEKRPFFLEGADFFNTLNQVVYTRTLRDPSWGVKLTGKEGANTVGAYMVRDTLTNFMFPDSEGSDSESLAMDSTATVLRYKRDLGSQYTLGALFTNRQGEDYHNRVYGFDGDLRFTSRDRLRFQVLASNTRYPNQLVQDYAQPMGDFNGYALDSLFIHSSRNFDFTAEYLDFGKDFRADLGFMPQVNIRLWHAGTSLKWFPKEGTKWFTRLTLGATADQITDHDGNLLQRNGTIQFIYEGPRQMHSVIRYYRSREIYEGNRYDKNDFFFHHCMTPIGAMHIWFDVHWGDRIDYSNNRLGNRLRLVPGIMYNIGLRLQFHLSHTFELMDVDPGRLYTANQSEVRLVYQFNKRTFLRTIFQYVDYDYNPSLYVDEQDPRYRNFFTQVLFSYKINPQTVLFLGYTDNYTGYDTLRLPRTNYTFFMKIGYALQM